MARGMPENIEVHENTLKPAIFHNICNSMAERTALYGVAKTQHSPSNRLCKATDSQLNE
jgi:hypothetical protein